jgi:hypothetical protein
MSYSRRQLYALGEPLGDSVTVKKVGGGRIYGGGGGGGGSAPAPAGPTQTTVQNTNIPEYAQPYVMNMLNAAQAQIYTPDMTGFNKYTPYSTNPQDYVAGFSPLQQQAQSAAANLKTPGAFGAAQGITGYGIGNALNMGANANPQNFQQQVGGYMNPYIQNALNPALAEIQRQYDITGLQQQGQATAAGAFGGSRGAIMDAENQRNKNMGMNQVIGQGYNQAFNAAQNQYNQNQGFGLQANQAAMQNANQLAGLGGQELAAKQSILGTQAQQGALEQQQQQNIINQGVQNYATAQQYPFLQLGMLNSMLRGLPMQQSSTQMYQAAPSQLSQLAGLGTAGLGAAAIYNASKADGGVIKMAPGGAVPMKMYTDDQLARVPQSPVSTPIDDMYAQGLMQERAYNRSNPQAAPQAASLMQSSPLQPGLPQNVPQQAGLAAAPTGNMTQMAEGGIASFAEGEDVPKEKAPPTMADVIKQFTDKKGNVDYGKAGVALMSMENAAPKQRAIEKEELKKSIAEQKGMIIPSALTRFGLNMMNAPAGQAGGEFSQLASNVGRSGIAALGPFERENSAILGLKRELAQMDSKGIAADNKERLEKAGELIKIQSNLDMKNAQLAAAGASRENTQSYKDMQLTGMAQERYNTLLSQSLQYIKDNAKPGKPLYNKYKENPGQMEIDAANFAMSNLSPELRPLLKMTQFDPNQLNRNLGVIVPPAGSSKDRPPLSSFQKT